MLYLLYGDWGDATICKISEDKYFIRIFWKYAWHSYVCRVGEYIQINIHCTLLFGHMKGKTPFTSDQLKNIHK